MPRWATTTVYREPPRTNPLWRMIDRTQPDEDDLDDDYETHCKRETLTKEQLI